MTSFLWWTSDTLGLSLGVWHIHVNCTKRVVIRKCRRLYVCLWMWMCGRLSVSGAEQHNRNQQYFTQTLQTSKTTKHELDGTERTQCTLHDTRYTGVSRWETVASQAQDPASTPSVLFHRSLSSRLVSLAVLPYNRPCHVRPAGCKAPIAARAKPRSKSRRRRSRLDHVRT